MLGGAMDGRGLLSGNDFLWAEQRRLSEANATLAHANARLSRERDGLHARLAAAEGEARRLDAENRLLRCRVKDLAGELKAAAAVAAAPAAKSAIATKPNVPAAKRRKTPGRPAGHAAALRPPRRSSTRTSPCRCRSTPRATPPAPAARRNCRT